MKSPSANFNTSSPSVLSRKVHYRLIRASLRGKNHFFISVRLGTERCTLALPTQSEEQARNFYRVIRDGLVTPCTLADIVSDLG